MKYKTSSQGITLVKEFEGCRLKAYKPVASEKYYTIGYGHYGADVSANMQISQAQAEAYLVSDLVKFENAVNSYNLSWMNQNRFDALVSFAYNCGTGNLKILLDSGKRSASTVSSKIPAYNKAGGKVLAGLVRRRKAEKELFDKATEAGDIYYPKYTGTSGSIISALKAVGEKDTSLANRKKIGVLNGINGVGTISGNTQMLNLLKRGILKKV